MIVNWASVVAVEEEEGALELGFSSPPGTLGLYTEYEDHYVLVECLAVEHMGHLC
jgi:hypothetical protein